MSPDMTAISAAEWCEVVLDLAHSSARKDGLTVRGDLAHAIAHLERAKDDGYYLPDHDRVIAALTALITETQP